MNSSRSIHLSLSGGGLRAAFFHLGALHGLAIDGRLLQVRQLSTVSGGSLAAAICLAEWSKTARQSSCLKADDLQACTLHAFERLWNWSYACPRSRAFGSVRALTRVLVHGEVGFGAAMARQYKRLLKNDLDAEPLQHLADVLPEWGIATSDYSCGHRVMLVVNDQKRSRSADATYIPAKEIGVARALSASTGIPGVFEPLRWRDYQLADGGILDNQGLRELINPLTESLCIDAAAPLAISKRQSGWTAPFRAMDMLMEQTRSDVLKSKLSIGMVSIRDDIQSPSTFAWRKAIAELRTDLDRFTSIEADLAFLAGYQSVLGRPDIPPVAPIKRKSPQNTMELWRFVNDELPTTDAHISKLRQQLLHELERGRFRVFPGWRARDSWWPVMGFLQLYQTFVFFLVGVGYPIVLILLIEDRLRQSWISFGALLWILSFLSLAAMHWRQPEDSKPVRIKKILCTLIFSPLALILGTLGTLSWLATRLISDRDGSVIRLRKRVGKIMRSQVT